MAQDKKLVEDTKLNGLYNIEQYNKTELGKLWKEHFLYPQINELKKQLQSFYINNIRNSMFKYQLLK